MRVPTNLEVSVKETIFLKPNNDKTGIQQVSTPRSHRFVETNLVETDKVITVDIKRPAAGMLDYKMVFGDEKNMNDHAQYFSSIKSKITDQTIRQVNTALGAVLGIKPRISAALTAGDALKDVFEEHRVVAWKRFDVDSVDFEQQVADFIDTNLNCDLPCSPQAQAGGPMVK
jgi:hypothetical protein